MPKMELGSAFSLDSMEMVHIIKVMQNNNYSKKESAKILGIDLSSLWRKLKKYETTEQIFLVSKKIPAICTYLYTDKHGKEVVKQQKRTRVVKEFLFLNKGEEDA
jgi:hypothetical protein